MSAMMQVEGEENVMPAVAEIAKGKGKATTAAEKKAQSEETLPWVEKYRPKSLGDLVAHTEIINVIERLIKADKLPHLLLHGPPGTGKTSTILAAARELYGSAFTSMTLELNASDARGIDVVREQIKEFAGTKRLFSSGVKLVILDEADAMTNDAQFALRRVIEKYTKNTRFCLICNYVGKIISALQSRCTKFRFAPLLPEQVRERVEAISVKEGVKLGEGGVDALLDLSCGDMRRVLNVLQAVHVGYPEVSATNVYLCSGSPLPCDIEAALDALLNEPFKEAHSRLRALSLDKGYALTDVVKQLAVLVGSLQLHPIVLCQLYDALSNIEHRLAFATSEKLQLGSVVAAFAVAKATMSEAATATSGAVDATMD